MRAVTAESPCFPHNAHMKADVIDQSPQAPLDVAAVEAARVTHTRFSIEVIERCDSTNSLLLERAQQGAPGASVVICERQEAGRGRRGRAWISAPGDSLTFSLLWRFAPGTPAPVGLSLAVGVAVARALENLGASRIALKWPNDILGAGAKLGGILIETFLSGGSHAVVIGIGLNVRLTEDMARRVDAPVGALDQVMAGPPSRHRVLAALLDALAALLDEFAVSGFKPLRAAWQAHNAHAGKEVVILAEGAPPVTGRCIGVDEEGALLLDTGGDRRRIVSGDVSLRTA